MAQLITLEHFRSEERHYHIYLIRQSSLSHQTHYHNYFQLCFVTRGEVIHRQGGLSAHLTPGDAFIIPPGFPHSLHFCDANSEIYSLSFEESLFHPGFPQSNAYRFLSGLQRGEFEHDGLGVRLRVTLDKMQRKSVLQLIECLMHQQEADISPELSAAPSLISSILYLLAQSYYLQPQNADHLKELTNYNNALVACINYVEQHYRENLTLSSLAKQFGLSRSAFCSVFPQFAGLPFQQYITQKRISDAQAIIRSQPWKPLNQVGIEVGYAEPSTFYRNFLKVTGMSPAKYRELSNE